MNLLQDIITYVRRIIKSPSDAEITNALIIDYINRFWIMDVDARIQLFDLKTKYQFQTTPGYDQYNMPMYAFQSETPGSPNEDDISFYPMYQGFLSPAYINGVQVPLQTEKNGFFNAWPNIVQQMNIVETGDGGTNYTLRLPISPNQTTPITTPYEYLLRGHIDVTGCIAITNALNTSNYMSPPIVTSAQAVNTTIAGSPVANTFPAFYITANGADGSSIVVADSGQFLIGSQNHGLLMVPGQGPNGNQPLAGGYSTTLNTINYFTGEVNVTFPVAVPAGVNINVQCYFYQTGLPRAILFNNNTLTLRSPPSQQFLVEIEAYLSPAAFLNLGQSIQFAYMAEYIARGAARKILSDTGDIEQFNFYEPLFLEQETLVWKRSQRQFTASRTQTIYSQGPNQGQSGFNSLGGSGI